MMRNPFQTPFVAVFQNEVLLNCKRVAPYALMILFAANAVLWWGRGPAGLLGWATNSDYYIARNLLAFSFLLGPPIFNAVIMGDPVVRDFRAGIDPLIFSKPVNRAQYLMGKFFGNFFVLVCCLAAFPLTLLVLQAFRTSQMVVQPVRVLPYFKHFFFFVVITHLVLAAFYFTVGTLTRNSKIVYGLAACFYPLYISYGLVLPRALPPGWRIPLDLFLLSSGPSRNGFGHSADFLNHYVVRYSAAMIANRVLVILFASICLGILYVRFAISERPGGVEKLSVLNLSTAAEQVYYDSNSFQETDGEQFQRRDSLEKEMLRVVPLPQVARANEGIRANTNKLFAAMGVEFRLLLSERSLVVIMPLALILSTMEVMFWSVVPDPTYSAAYAGNTARSMTIFLLGLSVFYTGEAMHRDRELRIEPMLWSAPVSNWVLLMSKFFATIALTLSLATLIALMAIATQLLRGHRPIELQQYLLTYSLIVFPSLVFLAAMALVLNTVLREKYVTYVVSVGLAGAMFYLYSIGYQHWLYNPLAYHLWKYADLVGVNRNVLLLQRSFWLAVAILFLAFAHFYFARKTSSSVSRAGR